MGQWVLVGVLLVLVFGATAVAVVDADPVRRARPRRPDWLVPSPAQLRRLRLPLAFQGYDAPVVDATLDAVIEAYEELYIAAGPTAIARAEHRLAVRRGLEEPVRRAVRSASDPAAPERAGQEVLPKVSKADPARHTRAPGPRTEHGQGDAERGT